MRRTFDEFVSTEIALEMHDVVRHLRRLVQECAPDAKEGVSYNMPVWTVKHIIAYLNATKKDITFSFVRGVEFEDAYGLLRGRAKHARFVKLKPKQPINDEALCDYIQQAVEWDAK